MLFFVNLLILLIIFLLVRSNFVVIVVIACSCSAITTCGCTIRRNHVDVGEKRLRLGKKGGGELVGGNVSLLRVNH